MKKMSLNNKTMAARVKHLELRTVEEFYDLSKDPSCLNNLVLSEPHQAQVEALRSRLRSWMIRTKDPALSAFDKRHQPQALEQFVQRCRAQAQKAKEALRAYEKRKGYRF